MVHAQDDEMLKLEFEVLSRRDDDLSVKASAVLAFAGLLIAATLVLLAAEPQTALHTEPDALASVAAAASLLLLFVGAIFALLAIAMARVYDLSDAEAMMARLDRRMKTREALWGFSCVFTLLGSLAAGAAYALVLAANAFGVAF
jgi:hypothetical protein